MLTFLPYGVLFAFAVAIVSLCAAYYLRSKGY